LRGWVMLFSANSRSSLIREFSLTAERRCRCQVFAMIAGQGQHSVHLRSFALSYIPMSGKRSSVRGAGLPNENQHRCLR